MVQLGPNLYDGTSGIALFLAALSSVTGDGEAREIALRSIAPLAELLTSLAADPERAARLQMPIGGLIGLGSFIYALLQIGKLLGEPALTSAAHEATALLTPERIAADQRVRIQTGSAGVALVLLALHRECRGPNRLGKTPLDIALDCGQHLVRNRVSFEGRPRAWRLSPHKPPLGGFCYGASGIAYALLRLHEVAPRPELHEAAREGLMFLHGLYSPAHKNWRDIRASIQARLQVQTGMTWKDFWYADRSDSVTSVVPQDEHDRDLPLVDSFLDMWCHGSAGIALGKLASLQIMESPEIRAEIAGALELSCSYASEARFVAVEADDLCCGHMGRAEVLACASSILGDEELLMAGRTIAHHVWQRAKRKGRYVCSASRGTETFSPSLFQGAAGIGYTFLRLACPADLSSLLILEGAHSK